MENESNLPRAENLDEQKEQKEQREKEQREHEQYVKDYDQMVEDYQAQAQGRRTTWIKKFDHIPVRPKTFEAFREAKAQAGCKSDDEFIKKLLGI